MKPKERNVTAVPHVYQSISAVMAKLASAGISKSRKNEQQGYAFRGIDDVYNALAPFLAEEGLVILPRCLSREVVERQTQRGGALFYVTVDVEFVFASAKDGSTHVVRMPGEAMDSADKATNKAMSAAYKYACLQTFCIPTEGDNDADATTHTPAPVQARTARSDKPQGQFLGEAEQKAITDLAEKVGVDISKICAAYGVDSLDQIAMKETATIISKLQQKVKA